MGQPGSGTCSEQNSQEPLPLWGFQSSVFEGMEGV